jgi:glycosyltransferase involved in cell wall biosynthesis
VITAAGADLAREDGRWGNAAGKSGLRISAAVCTYRRPADLQRCLEALRRQERLPDEVVVVVRSTDGPSLALVHGFDWGALLPRIVTVSEPGVVPARNQALESYRGDIIAFTDDDAAPHREWIKAIEAHFMADAGLGGLGGRDRCHDGKSFDDRESPVVGKVQWFGRMIAEHHRGVGAPRSVQFLKGANMSFRRTAIADLHFDVRLRGTSCEDLAFSLAVNRRGWKVLYDPAVLVDHYPGRTAETRHYATIFTAVDCEGLTNFAFNQAITLRDELQGPRFAVFVIWSILVGTRACPGLLQALRFTPKLGVQSWRRFAHFQKGVFEAVLAVTRRRRTAAARPAVTGRSCLDGAQAADRPTRGGV